MKLEPIQIHPSFIWREKQVDDSRLECVELVNRHPDTECIRVIATLEIDQWSEIRISTSQSLLVERSAC